MEVSFNKFLEVWEPYHKELFWFVDYDLSKVLDNYTSLDGNDEPEAVKTRREFIFEQCKQVQYILLEIGEENLSVKPMYHWEELKLKHPKVGEIGFLTPFSYLCHWLSLPHLEGLVKDEGFRDALFVSGMYLDLLKKKLNLNSKK